MDFATIQRFFRENPRALILGAFALLAAGTFALWSFNGAGIEIGQFFAAEPMPTDFTGRKPTPTELRAFSQEQGWSEDFVRFNDAVLQDWIDCCWNISAKKFNSRREGVTGLWEKPTECPAGQVPGGPSETDPCIATPGGGGGGGGGTTTTPAPTTGPPVFCDPQNQTVAPGEIARIDASGGTGIFNWTASGGGVQEDGGATFRSYSWSLPGVKQVTVSSASQLAFCTVIVQQVATTSPTPTQATSGISVTKRVRNITNGETLPQTTTDARQGDIIRFTITIESESSEAITGVRVRDEVPAGMSYQSGSTTVDGVPSSNDNSIVTSGILVGALEPVATIIVTWDAIADQVAVLPAGIHTSPTTTYVTADTQQAQATISVAVISAGTTAVSPTPTAPGGVGTVQTGPGDALVVALAFAAMVAFLYTAYTRSPTFHRREAERLGQKRDPLDFRS